MRSRSLLACIALAVIALPLVGCKEAEEESAEGYVPATLEPVNGSEDLKLVTFTEEGVDRLALETGTVAGKGGSKTIPYAALLYGPEGETYVYTSPKTRTYLRKEVTVKDVQGDTVSLSKGPPAGTEVVTVGTAEVYGAEQEIAEK